MHVRTAHEAQSSSHRYVRVSEHRERMRADYQRMDDPYYEYYEERYAPAPRAGWWEWHAADDDYGPYYRW